MRGVVSGRPCWTSHLSSFADGAVYKRSLEAPPRRGAARTSRRDRPHLARARGADRPRRRSLDRRSAGPIRGRSEEHTSELQSLAYLVCRLLLEKKKIQSR